MNCPDCGRPPVSRRGRELGCSNGHLWRLPTSHTFAGHAPAYAMYATALPAEYGYLLP
jgi:hypothetical protein